MQPVHGYDVRRELVSWRLEELANVKPGSIYGAIRTLEKDGCIAVHAYEADERRPERTTYVLTGEGEKEFQLLLRQSWWTLSTSTEPLVPALSLMPFLPREELIRALQARLGALEGQIESLDFQRASIREGATGEGGEIPDHVRDILDFYASKLRAELDWTRRFQRKLRDGAYRFAGEPGFPELGPGKGMLNQA
jgi:DNA-binding PadR family transcriptional regulator